MYLYSANLLLISNYIQISKLLDIKRIVSYAEFCDAMFENIKSYFLKHFGYVRYFSINVKGWYTFGKEVDGL